MPEHPRSAQSAHTPPPRTVTEPADGRSPAAARRALGEKALVALLVLLCAAFVWGIGWIAYGFLRAGTAAGIGLGLALLLLGAISAWAIVREVQFGLAMQRLGRASLLDDRLNALSTDQARSIPDARADAEASPTAWQPWFRLAVAHSAHRERGAARAAMREAARRFDQQR